MTNSKFLDCIKASFLKFLETGSRSNEKLKILHGTIAQDIFYKLNAESNGKFFVKSLGFDNSQEGKISGRYIDKNVDIAIYRENQPIAGIAVKFVMQNYAQNSNNYFENMLGETANIKSKNIPYFQIFIIPEKLPYYELGGRFRKWENFNEHHLNKYKILSKDNEQLFMHTPTKTLIYIVKLPENEIEINNRQDYIRSYNNPNLDISLTKVSDENDFGDGVIINDYEQFINKVKHKILSI